MRPKPLPRLSRSALLAAVDELCARDCDLAGVVERCGPPPLWARSPGFATLVQLILEQQVSVASARAAFKRLCSELPVSAEHFAALEVADLRAHGLTRQKSGYCIALANAVVTGELKLRGLSRCDDDAARDKLTRIKGIGRWTADCYLLFCLRRPDVWPDGDIALAESARRLKRLAQRPDTVRLRRIAAAWSPWRAVGARILWHAYLAGDRAEAR